MEKSWIWILCWSRCCYCIWNKVGSGNAIDSVSGIITATAFGSGANLTGVISGVELKSEGNSVGTAITAINFVGFNSVTAPVGGSFHRN